MNKIQELREKRAALWDSAKDFLEDRYKVADTLNEEETREYEKMESEVVALGKEIERLEAYNSIELELKRPTTDRITVAAPGSKPRTSFQGTEEYSSAFWNAMKGSRLPEVHNALQVGTDSEGGYLVPDEFERKLIEGLEEENLLRRISKVIKTSSGDRKIPVVASKGTASWIDEEGAYIESDMKFNQVSIGAHKVGTMIKVSEELLNDSAFAIEPYIAREFARQIGQKEEEAFFTGDGTGKPMGLLHEGSNIEAGATAASGTAITFDDLIDLYYSVKEPYRKTAVFVMNEKTLKAVRKLKDTNGQYIWQPSVTAGTPDKILNCPVFTSPFIPEITAGAKSVIFGDFSYYWIADRQGRSFKRLNELYATTGQVGFLGMQRVDAKLILPEAIKVLVQKNA